MMTIYERLQGKKIDVNYETGYHFIIDFESETQLSWDALSKVAQGAPKHETEPYASLELGDDCYMVNWIEESGLVVSQVDDFKNGKVYAFMTWNDDTARGKRAQLLHQGTLTVLDK